MVGLTAAIIGSAVIGAGASAIGASKNSKAINRATDAQTAANDQAVVLQREARDQNVQYQNPFYQTGLSANNRINALLGLSTPQPVQQQQPQYGFGQQGAPYGYQGGSGIGDGMIERRYEDYGDIGGGMPRFNMGTDGMYGGPQEYNFAQQMQPQVQPQTNELADAQQGFGDWRDNSGYQFRFNEGVRALDAGASASGVRNSGAAQKALAKYGQNIGSQEFYNYLGALTGQQQVGTGAANALSGVNSNYANNASNIAQQQGQNIANSAVAKANNTNNMIGGITSSFGNALGNYAGMGGFGASMNGSINNMFKSNPGIF
jgi:hypothetical protein